MKKNKKIINDTLTIKDFIIIGDKKFHEKIKTVEKSIKSRSFKYLNIKEVHKYLDLNIKNKDVRIQRYFYMLIIKFEEFKENFKNILSLTFELGVTFLTFLYMENGDIEKFL